MNSSSYAASRPFSLAVIICTRHRPGSLRQVLKSMVLADRSGLELRVIVVNNSESLENEAVVSEMEDLIPLRLVSETRAGKSFALNRGLLECGDAEIIAVVDDDITVERGWFLGVQRITERWPNKGFFAGSSFIVWPPVEVPMWARSPYLKGWAFSVLEARQDQTIKPGHWASGNCFWFRARLLPKGYQFPDGWLTEPPLMLDLAERGQGGVVGPDAVSYHHISEDLLDLSTIRRRATKAGCAFAEARLVPFRKSIKQAVLFKKHPLLARCYCCLSVLSWFGFYCMAALGVSPARCLERKLLALDRMAAHLCYLRVCGRCKEYRIRIWDRHSNVLLNDGP